MPAGSATQSVASYVVDEYDTDYVYQDGIILNVSKGDSALGSIKFVNHNSDKLNVVYSLKDVTPINVIRSSLGNVLVEGNAGRDYISASGESKVTVKALGDDDIIINYATAAKIAGGDGNDSIHSYAAKVSINAGTGNDTINNSGNRATIVGGTGNDSVFNGGDNVKIVTGTGTDVVYSYGNSVSIDLGTGNDSVQNSGNNVTILGGKGNDTLSGYGHGAVYVYTSGKDVIQNFNVTDTLLLEGCTWETLASSETNEYGNTDTNVLVNVFKGGSKVGTVKLVNYTYSTVNIVSSSKDIEPLNVVTNYSDNASVKGTDDKNYIDSNGANVSIVTGKKDDIINSNGSKVTITAGAGNDSVYSCRDNSSVNAGKGDDTITTWGNNNTIAGGAGNDSIYSHGVGDVYVYGGGNDTLNYFDPSGTLLLSGYKWETLANYATTEYGYTYQDSVLVNVLKDGATVGTINMTDYRNDTVNIVSSAKKVTRVDIIENSVSGAYLSGSGNRDSIYNYEATDVTITTGAGNDTVTNFASDYRYEDAATNPDRASIETGDGADYIENEGGSNVTINAGAGNDSIYNSGANVLFTYAAGDGNDTLIGGKGNDYLFGDAGNDVFVYSAGIENLNAVLHFDEGSLTVYNANELTIVDVNGKTLTTVIGTETYDDSSAAKITLGSGIAFGDASARTKLTRIVGNELDNSIVGGSGKDTIYGKDGDDWLEGGAGNDKLYGQNGYDMLWGGMGNDTLIGGGADGNTFIYNEGEGKDVITDFGNYDRLEITGDWTATYDAMNKVIAFKVGSTENAITLKDAAAGGTFNVNDDAYRISGTKLVK